MKTLSCTIALLSLFLLGAHSRVQETVITGQVIGNTDKIVFSNPNQGTNFTGFRDTTFVDENGRFELKFNLRQPAFISLWNPIERSFFRLLLEPGSQSHILIDTENGIEISGTNEAGQRLLKTLPNRLEIETIGSFAEKSSTAIYEKIQSLIEADMREFRQLRDENKISTSFYELIKIDRNVYYALVESNVLVFKTLAALMFEGRGDEFNNLLENWKRIYAQHPPDNENLLISTFWFEYAQMFFGEFALISEKDFNIFRMMELLDCGAVYAAFRINQAQKQLIGKSLEFFQAATLFSAARGNFGKKLIALFQQFKENYPKSEYSRYIQPLMDRIVAFHRDTDLSDNIIFIENSENINTLAELIEPMKGRKIYITVWATWCGPCRAAFRYSEVLREILDRNNIQMLYISIDNENATQQWKDIIRFHDLAGKHIRANENLIKNDLIDADSRSIAVPLYILIDEQGNILQRNAQEPSQIVSAGNIYF